MSTFAFDPNNLPVGLARLMKAGVIKSPEEAFEKSFKQFFEPAGLSMETLLASLPRSPEEALAAPPLGSLPTPELTPTAESADVAWGHFESLDSPRAHTHEDPASEAAPLARPDREGGPTTELPSAAPSGEPQTAKAPTPRCAATNKRREPCKAYPSLGTAFCLMHNPERADYVQESRRQGGRHRPPYQFAPQTESNFAHIDLNFHSPIEFQASLEAITQMVVLGRIPPRNAAIIMRLFEVASRIFAHITASRFQQAREAYDNQVDRLLYAADLIEDNLHSQRTQERVEALSDVRSRYEERFRTEDAWGRAPKLK